MIAAVWRQPGQRHFVGGKERQPLDSADRNRNSIDGPRRLHDQVPVVAVLMSIRNPRPQAI
jgi:hypothetical protein